MRISDWSSDVCSSDLVMEDFADSYLRGETPIPCVSCNRTGKFRDLLATARDLGADCLATGHYVQRKLGPAGAELHRAVDPRRDQSYFLIATTRGQLDFLRFPLGGMEQDAVRREAARFGLVVADQPSSEERRVGKECVSTCRSRWAQYH